MIHSRSGRLFLATWLAVAIAGCVRRESTTVDVTPDAMQATGLRTATNLPPQFAVVTAGAGPADCAPQLRDPGLGTTLRLRRSVLLPSTDTAAAGYRAMGDYAVEPAGRYGEEPGEGLRVDCARLRAIGVVRL